LKKKICVVTSGRADYWLLLPIMRGIQKSSELSLQVMAAGAHWSRKFGMTCRAIREDLFSIDAKIKMEINVGSATGLAATLGAGLQGMTAAFARLRPDLVLLLGDRHEILCAALAATLTRVPVAHIHGGEITAGAYDDMFRHAITKMSHFHFVSAHEHRQRVIQMGEPPSRVFRVGALAADNVRMQATLSRRQLAEELGCKFQKQNFLITFHPATLEPGQARWQISALLQAIRAFPEAGLFFTMPGADLEQDVIGQKIRAFAKRNPRAFIFQALGSRKYLSLMQQVDAVVGNSSSGLLEAPVLRKPTVNIGNRQKGRLQAGNVVNCPCQPKEIHQAIHKALSPAFLRKMERVPSPYGYGGAADRIVKILRKTKIRDRVLQKTFHDLSHPSFE